MAGGTAGKGSRRTSRALVRTACLASVLEVLARRGKHVALRLGERAVERRSGRLAVAAAAEALGQLGHVHVAERAEAHLHPSVRELAEQEREPDAGDGARILDDPIEIVGGGAVALVGVRWERDPIELELVHDSQGPWTQRVT